MVSSDTAKLFQDILQRVKSVDPVNVRSWFNQLKMVSFDGGHLVIAAPDKAMKQYLEDNSKSHFTQATQSLTGYLVSIEFVIGNGSVLEPRRLDVEKTEIKLNPDLTFENFVVGSCNRLAHASCIAVANAPGNTYNPLFLYGNVGLGKTHLLHAICSEAQKKDPDSTSAFLTCEEFVNKFIKSIEEGSISSFQGQFRNVDVLIIDDVQFLNGREASQEEFFHTFNALYDSRKQIVLSADCAPGEMKLLEERLISRFKWGLVARIDSPIYETRVAIVQKKAHMRGMEISKEVAEYIARKAESNIRELEGALTIVYAMAQTTGQEISIDLAMEALGEEPVVRKERSIRITDIIDAVTSYFDVRVADLQSKSRSKRIAFPRQVCMYLARKLTNHSLEEIGGHMGGRDHTTVMHAYNKLEQLIDADNHTKTQIDDLKKQIRQAG